MSAENELLDGKRVELQELFQKQFAPGKVNEMANVLWQFALDKFKRDQLGEVFLAFMDCTDRCMLSIVAKAQGANNNQIRSLVNPTEKGRIIVPD